MLATVATAATARWSTRRASSVVVILAFASASAGVVDVVKDERSHDPRCIPACIAPIEVTPRSALNEREELPVAPVAPVAPLEREGLPVAPVAPAAVPVTVTIASLDVHAPVDPVGLLVGGGLAVPDDAGRVGWFAPEGFELAPGDEGTAVLAGHRDSRRTGPGALHALVDIEPGARIAVHHADGRVSHWQVERSVLTSRDALPVDELFTRSGPPRLALVTCGGAFDPVLRRYSHNVLVYASLADVTN